MNSMKLNESDVALFKSLQQSDTGAMLEAYLKRLCDFICDLRNMEKLTDDERRGRLLAAEHIEQEIIDRIRMRNEFPKKQINPHV